MTDMLILMLPQARRLSEAAWQDSYDGAGPSVPYWAKITAGRVVDSGSGAGWREQINAAFGEEAAPPLRVLALAPAHDAPVRFVAYENLAPAQAAAVARVDALKLLLGNPAETHIASGLPSDIGQSFAVAVTRHSAMQAWQDWLTAEGVHADSILPIAALLPPPEGEGQVALDVGEERVIRTPHHGYASDAAIDALLGGEAAVQMVSEQEWQLALALATQSPPVDLLSGSWQRKAGWQVDERWLGWAKRLAAGLVILSLAVPLVQTVKYKLDEARADRAVVAAAAELGITAPDAASAEADIDRRLAQRADGPLAFSVPASALYAALADAPAVALKQLSHRGDGTLTAMLAAPRTEDLNPVLLALQARGYSITAQPMQGSDGQHQANITVRAVP